MKANFSLYDFQQILVDQTRDAYASGFRSPLLVSHTGSGKTVMYSHIADIMHKASKRALILEHRAELLTQTSDALTTFGVEHGIISPKFSPSFEDIQVASVQTLRNRLERTPRPDLIVIDEAHHSIKGNTWGMIIDHWDPKPRVLGVSATPLRTDGRGLGSASNGFFDTMIVGPTMDELIAKKRLSPFEFYAPKMNNENLDFSNIEKVGGDFVKSQLESVIDKPTITGSAVDHYRKICNGLPAIVFCVSVKHAYHVAEQFGAAGYRAKCVEGKTSPLERKAAIRHLGNGQLDILTSCDIISEGTDVPVVCCGILLRPTHSMVIHRQQPGRILRYQPGKIAYILDCVGNYKRNAIDGVWTLPNTEIKWDLNPPKRNKKKYEASHEIDTYQCLECFMVFKRGPAQCPHCGAFIDKDGREIKQVEGELELLTEQQFQKREVRKEQGRAQTLEQLLVIAKAKGYNAAWARHVFNGRKRRAV